MCECVNVCRSVRVRERFYVSMCEGSYMFHKECAGFISQCVKSSCSRARFMFQSIFSVKVSNTSSLSRTLSMMNPMPCRTDTRWRVRLRSKSLNSSNSESDNFRPLYPSTVPELSPSLSRRARSRSRSRPAPVWYLYSSSWK